MEWMEWMVHLLNESGTVARAHAGLLFEVLVSATHLLPTIQAAHAFPVAVAPSAGPQVLATERLRTKEISHKGGLEGPGGQMRQSV